MDHREFLTALTDRGPFASADEAAEATAATLSTLGERITAGAAGNLAAQLPPEIGQHLTAGAGEQSSSAAGAPVTADASAEPFTAEEFCARVAERLDEEGSQVRDQAASVLSTVRDAVDDGLWARITAQLPGSFVGELIGR